MSGVLNETYDSVRFQKGMGNITGLLLALHKVAIFQCQNRYFQNLALVLVRFVDWRRE